ncbi:MAG: DUF3300 domain-containing protein [Blastocatellia bacterium]|nr:DUF3300 domain-containing protein [Blastocatellia bacterium]
MTPGPGLVEGGTMQQPQQPATASNQNAAKIPPEQLDSLVAPIALYPDQLLSQVLVASTYPLEIIQLQQWLAKNPKLKDKALVDAVSKQPWDPSIQAMAPLPEVVKRLADDIQWTTDLGNAFLAQQSDVMDAVQRMRKKAKDNGALKSNDKQKVETKVVEKKTVIIVQQASPEVIYVPTYNPTVVYGPPIYPYPAVYYPAPVYSTGAVIATSAISFGFGVAMGAAWSGGWGWGCGWGHNDIDINVDNNFNRSNRANISGGNRATSAGNKWQHNPQHRGGTPYANQTTANRFGGTARGDSLSNRQSSARQQITRQGANPNSYAGARGGGAGVSAGGGGDRVGTRNIPTSSTNRSAFGGGSEGYSGSSSRASSSRGASSMAASRGGSRGMRGGGGRRR